MKQQTSEMEDLVRKAEHESDKIRQEKMSIMQRWTLSVINIAKRDEALVNFRLLKTFLSEEFPNGTVFLVVLMTLPLANMSQFP
jgi:hypothetical protein